MTTQERYVAAMVARLKTEAFLSARVEALLSGQAEGGSAEGSGPVEQVGDGAGADKKSEPPAASAPLGSRGDAAVRANNDALTKWVEALTRRLDASLATRTLTTTALADEQDRIASATALLKQQHTAIQHTLTKLVDYDSSLAAAVLRRPPSPSTTPSKEVATTPYAGAHVYLSPPPELLKGGADLTAPSPSRPNGKKGSTFSSQETRSTPSVEVANGPYAAAHKYLAKAETEAVELILGEQVRAAAPERVHTIAAIGCEGGDAFTPHALVTVQCSLSHLSVCRRSCAEPPEVQP